MKRPGWARVLRLPDRPIAQPASGIEVFRPAPELLYRRYLEWGLGQLPGLVGILFVLVFLGWIEMPFFDFVWMPNVDDWIPDFHFGLLGFEISTRALFRLFEIGAIGFFFAQLVAGGLLVGLGWAEQWYELGPRSLRVRKGVVRVREQTLTLANIQNLQIRRSPWDRIFGIATLEVHTAGGGAKGAGEDKEDAASHLVTLEGLPDAESVRDHLRRSMEEFRDAGLGDPDDSRTLPERAEDWSRLVEAAEALLREARALRSG